MTPDETADVSLLQKRIAELEVERDRLAWDLRHEEISSRNTCWWREMLDGLLKEVHDVVNDVDPAHAQDDTYQRNMPALPAQIRRLKDELQEALDRQTQLADLLRPFAAYYEKHREWFDKCKQVPLLANPAGRPFNEFPVSGDCQNAYTALHELKRARDSSGAAADPAVRAAARPAAARAGGANRTASRPCATTVAAPALVRTGRPAKSSGGARHGM